MTEVEEYTVTWTPANGFPGTTGSVVALEAVVGDDAPGAVVGGMPDVVGVSVVVETGVEVEEVVGASGAVVVGVGSVVDDVEVVVGPVVVGLGADVEEAEVVVVGVGTPGRVNVPARTFAGGEQLLNINEPPTNAATITIAVTNFFIAICSPKNQLVPTVQGPSSVVMAPTDCRRDVPLSTRAASLPEAAVPVRVA